MKKEIYFVLSVLTFFSAIYLNLPATKLNINHYKIQPMKYLLLAIPTLLLITGYNKLQDLKALFSDLNVTVRKVHHLKIKLVDRKVTFLADCSVSTKNAFQFNLNTLGLIELSRIFFYDHNSNFIGVGELNLTSINLGNNEPLELQNIPFTADLNKSGLSTLQKILRDPKSAKVRIELEFKAFNKTYKTPIK